MDASQEPPAQDEIVDIFLCHASPDKPWVKELAEQLESETFDGSSNGRPLRVFFDAWDIDAGHNFMDEMERGLRIARYVGVVLSPNMLRAPFAKQEWQHVLADDPTNRRRRLLPLLYRDADPDTGSRIDLPAPFRVLNWIDFRDERRFAKQVAELVRCVRDLPPKRGARRSPVAALAQPAATTPLDTAIPSEPDAVQEPLLSNMLAVESHPTTIWSAETPVRSPREIHEAVPQAPPFELRQGRLYTFADLTDRHVALRAVINPGSVHSERVEGWKADADRARWLVALVNRAVRGHLGGLPIRFDRDQGCFFFLPQAGADRRWRNGKDRPVAVAAKKARPSSPDHFWIHHAARLQARLIGSGLYISVEPTYAFSRDGARLVRATWTGSLKRNWSGRERNAAILRRILFWGRTLARGRKQIGLDSGAQPFIVSPVPALATASFGLADDQVKMRALLTSTEEDFDGVAGDVEFEDDE